MKDLKLIIKGVGKSLPLFLFGGAVLLQSPNSLAAEKKKPFPKGTSAKSAISAEPATWRFAVKGGMMTPAEGSLESAPMFSLEGQYVKNETSRLAIQADFARGDVTVAPGRTRESNQRYVHLSYRHHPGVKNAMGELYVGGGLSIGTVKARAGGTATGHGGHLFTGYVWRSGFLLEARYSFLSSEKNTDLGGLALQAGYQF